MFENKKGRHKLPSLNFSLYLHTDLLCTAQISKIKIKNIPSIVTFQFLQNLCLFILCIQLKICLKSILFSSQEFVFILGFDFLMTLQIRKLFTLYVSIFQAENKHTFSTRGVSKSQALS